MPLTDTTCRNARPKAGQSSIKLSDGNGMFLLVNGTGKYWRLAFRFDKKQKILALGVYPEVGLKEARERREEAKKLLSQGIDPTVNRKLLKTQKTLASLNCFEAIAREWFARFSKTWSKGHADRMISRLEGNIFPWIGSRPIEEIKPIELLSALRRVEDRGAIETAHRTLQSCSQIFRYAIASGRAHYNPASDLAGALSSYRSTSFPTITDPEKIGQLLRDIDLYKGTFITRCALRLAPYLFVRPGELRQAEWSEIDFEKAQWLIPSSRMKAREKHVVPLPTQAISILLELKPLTGAGRYLFPGARSNGKAMCENTLNKALRTLGYDKNTMTAHGFRHMASTLLNEQGWSGDAVERQLAHADRNKIRATYNYAEYMSERVRMMQAWADYLDSLKKSK